MNQILKGNRVRLDTKPTGQSTKDAPLTVGNLYEVVAIDGCCVVTTTDEPGQTVRYHRDRVTVME